MLVARRPTAEAMRPHQSRTRIGCAWMVIALLMAAHGRAVAQAPPQGTSVPVPGSPVQPSAALPGARGVHTGPPGTTYVSIETDDPRVWLQRRIGSLEARPEGMATGDPKPGEAPPVVDPPKAYGPYWEPDWERICITPCHKPVASGGIYRIGGEGVTPSDGFRVDGPNTKLDVDAGSASTRNVGAYMTVFGFLLAATGGVFLVMSVVSTEKESEDEDKAVIIAGTAGLIAGGVIGFTGMGLFIANGTTVRDGSGKELARGPIGVRAYGSF